VLFNALAHGHRLFIDDFFLHSEFIGNMMLEFHDSLVVNSNTENLRSKYILNPSNDGDCMTHPVKTPVCDEAGGVGVLCCDMMCCDIMCCDVMCVL
jgi:hypothetical protein